MNIATSEDMQSFGQRLGENLHGGECIELLGDVGAGKTTFVKGLGVGLGVDEDIQSPSFTLSRRYYASNDRVLDHYDFYRLNNAGVLSYELAESLADPRTVVVVEWGETVQAVLPAERITISISYLASSESRQVEINIPNTFNYLKEIA